MDIVVKTNGKFALIAAIGLGISACGNGEDRASIVNSPLGPVTCKAYEKEAKAITFPPEVSPESADLYCQKDDTKYLHRLLARTSRIL